MLIYKDQDIDNNYLHKQLRQYYKEQIHECSILGELQFLKRYKN